MKKLMMMLAAGLTATAMIAAVTSQNIVGYMAVDTPNSGEYMMYTPMFTTVGGGGASILLGDIVPNANFSGFNGDLISFINAAGNTTINATYYDDYGWCDPDDTEIMRDDVEIAAGTGFKMNTGNSGGALVCAGEVAAGALEVALPGSGQYAMVGNPSPVSLTLGDVVPNANFSGFNGDLIFFINAAGNTVINATYYDDYGWCDPDDTEIMLDDVVLNPGTTFKVNTGNSGGTLTFPSPL